MAFTFRMPVELHFGRGTFERVAGLSADLGRKALLVTTRFAMDRLGFAGALEERLAAEGVEVTRFREFRAGPSTAEVDHGAALAREREVDHIIALGGGSVMDGAKAIAAVCSGSSPAVDHLYGRATAGPASPPIIAVPTTSGTGSETNRSGIVADSASPYKDGFRSPRLFPRHAVVDPELTRGMGPEITAVTGWDALTHAIESYASPKANPLTDGLALRAIELVARWLPVAVEDPENGDARESLALASTTMGFNLTAVGTCLPHRIDKAICALHPNIEHGRALALIYPAWSRRSMTGNADRFARIADRLDPASGGDFPAAIDAFHERIGLRADASELGLRRGDIPTLVENVAGDLSIDPVPMKREDLPAFLDRVIPEE